MAASPLGRLLTGGSISALSISHGGSVTETRGIYSLLIAETISSFSSRYLSRNLGSRNEAMLKSCCTSGEVFRCAKSLEMTHFRNHAAVSF